MSNCGEITLKWNTEDLEMRTSTIENILEPLIANITTLVDNKNVNHDKKKFNKSVSVKALVESVEKSIDNFITVGLKIVDENPDIKNEMNFAINEVKTSGNSLSIDARNFAVNPCSSSLRKNMTQSSRILLLAVTRLLILADMIDVSLLQKQLNNIKNELEALKNVKSNDDLITAIKKLGNNLNELMKHALKRQCEIKNPELRDKIAGARAVIKKNQPFLLSSSKVYVNHPDMAVAKKIYDNVLDELNEALDNIKNAAEGKLSKEHVKPVDRPGQLVDALEKFDVNTYLRSSPTHEYLEKDKPNLQEQLDDIVAQVVYIGDSSGTRINRRNQMIEGCEAVKNALQNLLTEYINNTNNDKKQPDNLNNAIEDISKKTWDLRDNIRKAVVDNISDSFLDTGVPLFDMIIAAENGDEDKFNDASIAFEKHAVKLIEVGHLACCMSENIDGIKMVNCCIEQISKLYPKVIDAAKILVVHSNSIPAKENMQVFHKAWEKQVKILIDAVDDITTIDDFLGVTEAHILEDINNCVIALQKNDRLAFVLSSDAILNRSRRVSNVVNGHVTQEMYQPSIYKKRILDAVVVLQDKIMPKFLRGVKLALDSITADKIRTQDDKKKDEDLFIDSSNIVYNGVHEIRRALLMNKLDDDDDIDLNNSESNENNLIDEYPNIGCIKNARDVMKIMNDKDKEKIIKEVEFFKNEKIKFDKEVEKWDDSGNDIILLAKKMCIIMMEMIDFTRGCGPLKTTMDIINAAKKISVNGTKLNELISQIIENCPESTTKNDLLGYIQRIYFHCHQMNITSKVKADVVQSINGELFVSGLDSATSLIQSSKNLMNAVVHTVKASYIASTKYPRTDTNTPIVVWKMKAPEKKPLVRRETSSKKNIIRRESQKMEQSPIKVLSDFQSLDERSLF